VDNIEQTVAEFIHLHAMFVGADRILLAISGGTDSTALLHILQALRTCASLHAELVCAHVNHQLRGRASDDDERFVVEQAGRLGLPVIRETVDVRTYARTHRLSVETAARRLRLEALSRIAQSAGCAWVATGHQKNDNAETIIQRLRRGTGFRGLAGIQPIRRFAAGPWFASPLLCVTREEVLGYLTAHKLTWREDRSNLDPAYTRNYIRHRLLPALQRQSQASLVEELAELAASARGLYDQTRRAAEQAFVKLAESSDDIVAVTTSGVASLPELTAVEVIRQAVVSLGGGERNLTENHYRRVLQLARCPSGERAVCLPGGITARWEGEKVILAATSRRTHEVHTVAPQPTVVHVPGQTTWGRYRIEAQVLGRKELDMTRIKGDKHPFTEYLDLDRIRPPITVRSRQAGDRFRPLGMAGEKKLGKFLTAAGAGREMREQLVVFADPEKIIWACPIRISEAAKVTDATRRILMLSVAQDREDL
jgi:tRNA(Ile)-lysidine synthase